MLYEKPLMQVIKLESADVITSSAGGYQDPTKPGDEVLDLENGIW